MSVIDRAKARFEARPRNSINVPEWSEDGKSEFNLFFKTPNASLLGKVNREAKGDPLTMAAMLVCWSLETEAGERVFGFYDWKELLVHTDPAVFVRVSNYITELAKLDTSVAGMAEAEKNLTTTQ